MRRLKRLLRYIPRRANLHRYPFLGRFADAARRRDYLWSLKPRHVRPALYFGSILALLPVMGIQIPLAFVLALVFRANVMVAAALQLITNPLSAAAVYLFTYQVGKFTLGGLGLRPTESATGAENAWAEVALDPRHLPALDSATSWSTTLIAATAALCVGGTLCGLALGAIMDLLYRRGLARPRVAFRR